MLLKITLLEKVSGGGGGRGQDREHNLIVRDK